VGACVSRQPCAVSCYRLCVSAAPSAGFAKRVTLSGACTAIAQWAPHRSNDRVCGPVRRLAVSGLVLGLGGGGQVVASSSGCDGNDSRGNASWVRTGGRHRSGSANCTGVCASAGILQDCHACQSPWFVLISFLVTVAGLAAAGRSGGYRPPPQSSRDPRLLFIKQ
jgi:hypothetical protein